MEGIDHKYLNALNNKWENLRLANKSQNATNTKKRRGNVATTYKGVKLEKSGKFLARIHRKDAGTIILGRFSTAEEAHGAYKEAAVKLFGEFARFE